MKKYSHLTLAGLHDLFQSSEIEGAQGFRVRCEILVEYDRRGEPHPRAGRSLYRYYREVASGKLSPLLVQHYSADTAVISRLMNQSIEKQDSFVRGETPIHVARFDGGGHLRVETKPLARATPFERTLALTESGTLRPTNKQRDLLLAHQKTARANRSSNVLSIKADKQKGELVCGQMRFTPHQLAPALKALGFRLVRIES